VELEILDPRSDAEPAYWRGLREQAGLRGDWAWDVLAVQAWTGRTPLIVAVATDRGVPYAVVCAEWAGVPVRRNGFVGTGRARLLGGLHVRAPGTGAVPGWWVADGVPVGELLRGYVRTMRRELGRSCRGALLRQLSETTVADLRTSRRMVRPTEAVAVIDTTGWRTLEDWTATLARKRRQNLRKVYRVVDDAPGVEVSVVPGGTADPVAVAAVLQHNERKYRTGLLSPLPQTTAYLAALLSQPDVYLGRYVDRETGRLLAVVSILDHPQWPVTRHWSAVPWETGVRPNLYLHHYGTVLSWSISKGRRGVIVGKGMATLKQSLGAEPLAQYAAVIR